MSFKQFFVFFGILVCIQFVVTFRIRVFKEQKNTAGVYYMDGELLNFRRQENEEMEYFSRSLRRIGRCSNAHDQRTNCVRLTNKIYKFEFAGAYDIDQNLDDFTYENEGTMIEDVELAAEMVFINDGDAKIIEEYEAKKRIEERAEFETQDMFANTDIVQVQAYVQVYGGKGIPFLTDGQFLGSLQANFENDEYSMHYETKRKIVGTAREFTIKQHIEVPACSEYKVNFYVKTVVGQSIDYKIYAKISGELEGVGSGLMMTTGQIRQHLDNRGSRWVILEDLDEFTVIAYQDAKMKATYGIKTIVHGKGSEIVGCEKKSEERNKRKRRNAF